MMMRYSLSFLIIIVVALLLPLKARQQNLSQDGSFSDNAILNEYIKEAYAYSLPKNYVPLKVSVCFGKKTKKGLYYNYVRIGNEMKGKSAYVELISETFETYEKAILASKKYVGIYESSEGLIKCDFAHVPDGFSRSFFVISMTLRISIILRLSNNICRRIVCLKNHL